MRVRAAPRGVASGHAPATSAISKIRDAHEADGRCRSGEAGDPVG